MAQVTFYHVDKRPNSLKIPLSTGGVTKEVKLKNETSKFSPSFYLSDIKPTWNYLKWDGLYFYISDVITIRNNYYLINTTLDVLASYRTEILNTNAYVRYSTSDYDVMIPDERVSIGSEVTYTSTKYKLFQPITIGSTLKSGTYVVSYVTTKSTLGPSGCIWLDHANAIKLANILNDGGFLNAMLHTDIGELVSKKIDNVYDTILNCKYIPLDLSESSGASAKVFLGGYDTNIFGSVPNTSISQSHRITLPKPFSDFRQLSPYTDYYIVLPGVGIIPFPANILVNRDDININSFLDGVTGDIVYVIDDTTRVSGNISTNIAINKISNPGIISGIAGLGGAIAAAATGHLGVAAASIFGSSITMGQVETGATGGLASNINMFEMSDLFSPGEIGIVAISRGTNTDPSTMVNHLGRPLNQSRTLNSLTGYCQTVGVSVSCNAPIEIKEQINNLLNGGVYIE